MKKPFYKHPLFLTIGGIILFFYFSPYILNSKSNIKGENIKKIRLGMSLDDLESLIGKPIKIIEAPGLHNNNCKNPRDHSLKIDDNKKISLIIEEFYKDTNYCCEGNREDLNDKDITLNYTEHKTRSHPMLWIHLDKNLRVNSVTAKRYEFLDFDGKFIFYLLEKTIPVDDSVVAKKSEQKKFDYFIDEWLFYWSFQ
jgi:hypothetical protein